MYESMSGRHHWFAKRLNERGYRTVIFCANTCYGRPGSYLDLGGSRYKRVSSDDEVDYVFVECRDYVGNGVDRVLNMTSFHSGVKWAMASVARAQGRPELILASSVHPLTLVAGEDMARRWRIPCICEVRDLWPETFFYAGALREKSVPGRLLTAGERWIYDRADALVFLKPGDPSYVREHAWDTESGGRIDYSRCYYINNGVDLAAFDERVATERVEDPDLESGKSLFVYAGTINMTNAVGNLVDAARLLSDREDVKLLVYGSGVDLEPLRERVRKEGLENIELKGFVERKYIPYILSKSRASILNYSSTGYNWRRGNSSNKLFEYLAAGRPVISTVRMAFSPIEECECGVSLDTADAPHLAEAIRAMCDMPIEDYEAMSRNARACAEQYDFGRLTDSLEEVIETVMSGPSRSPERPFSLKSLLRQYGPTWVANRALYAGKLQLLGRAPASSRLFERDARVCRTDLFDDVIDFDGEERFLVALPEDEKSKILERADKACDGVIEAFSSVELSYGDPLDWFISPVTGASVDPSLPWYRIPDFSDELGDIKVLWEPSRFTHLLLLARAALLSGNAKYHEAFARHTADWLKRNEYGRGPNYKCGQEASLRMLNVMMAHSCFKHLGMATEEDEATVRGIVEGSYRKVMSNFFYARRCIRNNHTLSEACGMYVGAWCCGDVRVMAKAKGYFEEAVLYQFRPDGGYVQWSFNYQRFALQICEALICAMRATGDSLSSACLERVARSAELLYQFQDETTGWLPNYGSNDGALPFPLSQCDFRDYSPTINSLLALLRGKTPYDTSILSEEAVWFGLQQDARHVDEPRGSALYDAAGLAVLREGDAFATLCAQSYLHNRPGHLDQMHVDLWSNGINVLCDGGTYSYASEEGAYLASTAAHNTVVVGGAEQMTFCPPFMVLDWCERGKFALERDFASCETTYSSGCSHSRSVGLKDGTVTIVDSVAGVEDGCRELLFHTTCDVELEGRNAILRVGPTPIAAITFDDEGLVALSAARAVSSPLYLVKMACNAIRARYLPREDAIVTTVGLLGQRQRTTTD